MVGFSSNATTIAGDVNGKIHDAIVQGHRSNTLVVNSREGNCPVDLDHALSHLLFLASIPVGSADTSRRKLSKSKLYGAINPACPKPSLFPDRTKKYLIYKI